MKLLLNGAERQFPELASLVELLRALELDPTQGGVAVALNGRVVRRADLEKTPLSDGDRVEVIHAVQGG